MFEIPENKATKLKPISFVVLATVLSIGAYGYFIKDDEAEFTPIKIVQSDYIESIDVYGTLQSTVKSSINSASSGRIKELRLYPGQKVSEGEVLALIENPLLERELIDNELHLKELSLELDALKASHQESSVQSKLEIELSKNKINLLQSKVKASADLYEKNIMSAFDFEAIKLELQQAKLELKLLQTKLETAKVSMNAQVKSQEFSIIKAQAQRELLRNDIDNLQIKAGIDGVVTKVSEVLELGQLLNTGDSLGQISNVDSLFAELYVASAEAQHLVLGQEVKLTAQNKNFTAYVSNVSQQVEKGMVRLDARLDTPHTFRPNTSVSGNVVLLEQSNAHVLEISTLPSRDLSELEFYVDDNSALSVVNLPIERFNNDYYLLNSKGIPTKSLFVKKQEYR